MHRQQVEFEVRHQELPRPCWVIFARWPNGRDEQLVGLFIEKAYALNWIRNQGAVWISHRNAQLD